MSDPFRLEEIINEAIYRHDPMRLKQFDVPSNEYITEARAIESKIADVYSLEQLHRMIHQIFVEKFDTQMAGEQERYLDLAQDIWERWLEWKRVQQRG